MPPHDAVTVNQDIAVSNRSIKRVGLGRVMQSPVVCLSVIGLVAVTMLSWSWGTWPDVLIDFGRELYVPWQLATGKILYADIAYFNGPFSPYLNSLWFRLFGVSLRTLVTCNLAILALLTVLLYQMVLWLDVCS